jgi:hypothetical protein
VPPLRHLAFGLIASLLTLALPVRAAEGCLSCHAGASQGFNSAHQFAAENCTTCHSGDPLASDAANAHTGMSAFPGNMNNAVEACGSCHADKVDSVSHSLMHTGHGMVETTRRLVDGEAETQGPNNLQSLGHGPADSMLRKLCASCHLGQEKDSHKLDPVSDRGGGCLACHINHYPEQGHPALSREVSDGRCFGCHSRSGRISLSYAGLAEVIAGGDKQLRLGDGRAVERLPADVHHRAGMGCVDCHSGGEVMGDKNAAPASCSDCHQLGPEHAAYTDDHERLECVTCHSQWMPRCFGCHMEYDGQGEQWDHIEGKPTPGRWHETRSDIRNGLGVLGINEQGRIDLFTPGMIMTLAHPDWEQEKFLRVFAPLSPHTTGKARSCESCHRSTEALGLGAGALEAKDGRLEFTPAHEKLQDGLPLDAWIDLEGGGGATPRPGLRSLSRDEIETIHRAPLPER